MILSPPIVSLKRVVERIGLSPTAAVHARNRETLSGLITKSQLLQRSALCSLTRQAQGGGIPNILTEICTLA